MKKKIRDIDIMAMVVIIMNITDIMGIMVLMLNICTKNPLALIKESIFIDLRKWETSWMKKSLIKSMKESRFYYPVWKIN